MAAKNSKHDEAILYLEKALLKAPDEEKRPIFVWDQLLDISDYLYKKYKDKRYKNYVIKLANMKMKFEPFSSTGYAYSYLYADKKNQNHLAIAYKLDRNSILLKNISSTEKQKAIKLFERNNPFITKKHKGKKKFGIYLVFNTYLSYCFIFYP